MRMTLPVRSENLKNQDENEFSLLKQLFGLWGRCRYAMRQPP
jgi:hypothetical protein